MKRISLQFSALLAALFLFAFSCQDHVVPEEPEPETPAEAPVVQTAALTIENQNTNLYRYKLNVEKLGNVQITGYGVVFSAEFNSNAPFTKTPTVADNKVVFPIPIGSGEKFKVDAAPPIGYKTIYYRAYVTYGVNSVAYGNVMEFSPIPLEEAKIMTLALESLATDNMYRYKVSFQTLGEVGIQEYGILVTFKESENDVNYNVNPVIENFDKKVLFITTPVVGEIGFDVNLADEVGLYEKYYRAYAILSNGSVVYGYVLDYD